MSDFKVFTSAEMTNDEYHATDTWVNEYVSGSSLAEIYYTCGAKWKFKEREETKALTFGTQSHTNFESAELFAKTYRRATNPEEVKDLITSQAALATKLKSFGLTGTSGKTYPDLVKMMVDCGEDLKVLWLIEMVEQCQAWADGVELVPAVLYDACVAMRQTLELVPEHNACMNSPTAQRELSIFGVINGVKVKVRLDHVDIVKDVEIAGKDDAGNDVMVTHPEVVVITDYKSTSDASEDEFGRSCVNHGYLLKMALQRDLFKKVFNEKRPIIVRLLAQEKKKPFLPLAHRLSAKHLEIGRTQYMSVIHKFAIYQANDVWPGYANNAAEVELKLPEWFMRQWQ